MFTFHAIGIRLLLKHLKSLTKLYGRHAVYSDGGGGCWYPEACNSLRLKHILHSPFEKGVIERAKEYVKDRTEDFGDYYPHRKSMIDWVAKEKNMAKDN